MAKIMQGDMKHMNYKWENRINWDFFNSKKILVAGGTGFIGSQLIRMLEKHQIKSDVLTRRKIENSKYTNYIVSDFTENNAFNDINIKDEYDILIYLAANIPLRGEKKENFQDATNSTLNPFIAFATRFVHKNCKLIYASSVDVLGDCNKYDFNENESINNPTPYGLAKYCGEIYARRICENNDAKCISLRFSQVYGPKEPMVRVIPIAMDAIINNKQFDIWTDGQEKRRFLYVDDAVQAIVLSITKSGIGICNVAGDDVIAMVQLIEMMKSLWNPSFEYKILNNVDGKDNVPSYSKIREDFGFIPEVKIFEGLKKLRGDKQNESL